MPIEEQALDKKKLSVDFREISLTGSQIYHSTGMPDYNPDSLVSRKGLDIYSRMREDDQIKAVLTMKKFARLATSWEIQPASQDVMDVEIADFIKVNFQNLSGTFEDCLVNILTALDYGYSVTEKIWYRIDKGQFAGKIGLKALKTREPFYYQFESDVFGNLKEDGIIYVGPTPIDLKSNVMTMPNLLKNRSFGYRLPINKFIIYSYNKEFSNWYGRSDLRSAYRCYSDDTEILTESGWKFIKDVTINERVATLNVKDELEYHYPINAFAYDYNGEMFAQTGRFIDLLVTPNHNMYVRKFKKSKKYAFVEAKNLKKNVIFKRNVNWNGIEKKNFVLPAIKFIQRINGKNRNSVKTTIVPEFVIDMDAWLAFLGIWLAEGCVYKHKYTNQCLVMLSQKFGKKLELIKEMVSKCGFKFHIKKDVNDKCTIVITNKQLYIYLRQFGHARDKFIPVEIKQLSSRQLTILYDALCLGDGTADGRQYFTISKRLADDVSEIVFKIGWAASVKLAFRRATDTRFSDHYIWIVQKSVKIFETNCNSHGKDGRQLVDYDGKVYCVEVPNHTLFVRRNGKACWCGNSWFSKEILVRFMNIYLERFGMPTHVARVPKNMGKADKETIQGLIDKVQSKYAITIPNDIEIELLQVAGSGGEAYKSAIEMHNKFISRSILVPDLLGFNEISSGAYALGKKHFDVFLMILTKLGRDLEETIIGEQLIKQLVDYNYSNVEKYPTFKFESITAEGTATRANIVQMGVSGGFINPEEAWIREYLAIPKADPSKPLGLPKEQLPGGLGLGQVPQKPGTDEGLKDTEDKNIDDLLADVDDEVNIDKEMQKYNDAIRKWKVKKYAEEIEGKIESTRIQKFQKSNIFPIDKRFDYKVDFAKMKEDLDEYELEAVDSLSKIVQSQRDALLRTIERKKIVENKDYDAINALQLRYVGEFKREVENRLIKLYLDSKLEALREVSEGSDNIEITTKFANITIQPWIPVQPTEAIDFFNRKVLAKIVTVDGIKKLLQLANRKELAYYDAKAFAISGIEKDTILKKAKMILLEGLKIGDSAKDVMFNLKTMFDEYLVTGEIEDDELIIPHRLETIVRTNFSEAMNAGRKAMMDDEDLGDFVPYRQYKAIMDDRVRPSHAEMHNKIFKSSDPIWDEITPPNGFNCFDKETEVYTNLGWRKFSELVGIEKFLTLNMQTRDIEYSNAIKYYKYQHSGLMYNFKAMNLDIMVTSNHNMIVRKSWDRKKNRKTLRFIQAKDIINSDQFYRKCEWNSHLEQEGYLEYFDKETFAKFMGWWLSEGSITWHINVHKFVIKIAQYNQIKKQQIVNDLQSIKDKLWVGKNCIYVKPWESLVIYLKQFGKSYQKFVPNEIKLMSKENINLFLNAYISGDGTINKKGVKLIYTSSKQMSDDMCELILKAGYYPRVNKHMHVGKQMKIRDNIYKLNHDIYRITLNTSEYFNFHNKMSALRLIEYNDFVYCVEVEKNNTLWIRRNGITCWVGNCRCTIIPITKLEIQRLIKQGEGIEVSNVSDIPADFPDVGFKKYSNLIECLNVDLRRFTAEDDDLQIIQSTLQQLRSRSQNKDLKINELQENINVIKIQLSELDKKLQDKIGVENKIKLSDEQLKGIQVEKQKLLDSISSMTNIHSEKLSLLQSEKEILNSRIDILSKDLQDLLNRDKLKKQLPDGVDVVGEYDRLERCPYPNCGTSNIETEIKNGEKLIECSDCKNRAKINHKGQLFFFDKGVNQWVRHYSVIISKIVEALKCPYPNCGSDKIVEFENNVDFGLRIYLCSNCQNVFKLLNTGELYLFDKGVGKWIKEDMKAKPNYITGER